MLFSTAAASTHIHTSIRLTNLISLKYSIKDKTIMSAHFCFVYFCTQTAFSMYFITKSVYFTLQTIKHVRHKLNSPKSKEQYNPESHISDSHTLSLAFSWLAVAPTCHCLVRLLSCQNNVWNIWAGVWRTHRIPTRHHWRSTDYELLIQDCRGNSERLRNINLTQ